MHIVGAHHKLLIESVYSETFLTGKYRGTVEIKWSASLLHYVSPEDTNHVWYQSLEWSGCSAQLKAYLERQLFQKPDSELDIK